MTSTRVGVDLGGTKLLVRIARATGVVLEQLPTGRDFAPADLVQALRRLLASSDPDHTSIGIAVPGLVGEDQRVIACDVLARFVDWSPRELGELAAKFWIVNDAEAALREETRESAARNAAMIMVGTRIGAAFTTNGRLLQGARGWAGEIGYLPVREAGRVTTLDSVASGEALTERLRLSGARIMERLDAGDPVVQSAVENAGSSLGLGIASVINLLNPELVVLGGGTTRLPGYLDAALRSAAEWALPPLWQCCVVRAAQAPEECVARGAALDPP